jgi:nucleoside-diphosphate-sugar epimerase
VLAAGAEHPGVVKTAIICPPTIYGVGRGPGNTKSRQVNVLAETTLKRGKAVQSGRGLTEWDDVHVHDLAKLFVLLVEAAVKGDGKDDGELWGAKGYYLAESGHHVWGEVSREIARVAHKSQFIDSDEVEALDVKGLTALGDQAMTWGLNSKGFAKRARKFLGWKPVERSLKEEIPDIVESEAKELGLKKGHREKVLESH